MSIRRHGNPFVPGRNSPPRSKYQTRLWKAVWEVAAEHNGLSPALDAVLRAGKWGVKKTKATELVNMIDKTQSELAGTESLSQSWAKRRKR